MGRVLGETVSDVPVILTPSNFSEVLESNEYVLVNFMAPWCGVCKRVAPEFEEGAHIFATSPETRDRGVFATFDAVAFKHFADDEGVRHYPTFILYHGTGASKKVGEEEGEQEVEREKTRVPIFQTGGGFVSAVRTKMGLETVPPVKTINEGPADVLQWLFWRGTDEGRLPSTLLLFDPVEDAPGASAMRNAFNGVAERHSAAAHYRFARITNATAADGFKLSTTQPTVVLYKDYDEGKRIYPGRGLEDENGELIHVDEEEDVVQESVDGEGDEGDHRTDGLCTVDGEGNVGCAEDDDQAYVEELDDWFRRWNTPLVTLGTHLSIKSIRSHGQDICFVFVPQGSIEDPRLLSNVTNQLKQVSQQLEEEQVIHRGQLTILAVDGQKYNNWMREFGLPLWEFPAAVIESQSSGATYSIDLSSAAPYETLDQRTARIVKQNAEEANKPQPSPDAMGMVPPPPIDYTNDFVALDLEGLKQGIREYVEGGLEPDVTGRTPEDQEVFDVDPTPEDELEG